MPVYYTGLNASPVFSNQDGILTSVPRLTEIAFPAVTDIEIGWNYFLLWRGAELYITGKISEDNDKSEPHLIQIPTESSAGYRFLYLLCAFPFICMYYHAFHFDAVVRWLFLVRIEFLFSQQATKSGRTKYMTILGRDWHLKLISWRVNTVLNCQKRNA
jgi:hypothetical protein